MYIYTHLRGHGGRQKERIYTPLPIFKYAFNQESRWIPWQMLTYIAILLYTWKKGVVKQVQQ